MTAEVDTHRETIALTIDGRALEATAGLTVLEICRAHDIHIPTLCHDPRLEPYGACRLCIVEVEGMRGYPTACTTVASDGMVVTTRSDALFDLRRTIVELLLSDHKIECLTCESGGKCGLQDVAYEHSIEMSALPSLSGEKHLVELVDDNPLIERDLEKCISCGRCVRICEEVQGCDVYRAAGRGFDSLPNTPFGVSLLRAGCEFCGQCVSTCPTGALTDRPSRFRGRPWEVSWTQTTCGYCGVGCTVELATKDGELVGARAPLDSPPNFGNLCAKGRYGWSFAQHPDRLTTPLVRDEDGELVSAGWDEAIALIAEKLGGVRDTCGPNAVGGLASAKCTNEENYLFQKLLRAGIGTHNIDHCARLCHSSTVTGLAAAFGSGAMTNSIEDLNQADVVLVIGSNTTEAHPIIGVELKKAARRGTRIYVVDPREIRLTRHAARWLPVEPGANVALVNAMMRIIIEEGLADATFIAERTEGFEALRELVADYDLEWAAQTCGVSVDDIRELAIAYGSAKAASIVYAMGVTQHTSGTEQVRALANLAMLTGNIGRPGTGVNPLRGQSNVQGACDLACLPNCLPGYQPLTDRGTIDRVCELWETDTELPDEPGLTLIEMMDAATRGELKAMYVMGENPVIADPDTEHVIEALEALDFLVVADIFMTETAALADVVLPAASFLEKDGTFTNTERRIKRARKVIESPGDALTDFEILTRLFSAFGIESDYDGPSDVMDEMAAVTPQYGGVSYRRLEAEGSLQWPCPDDEHPGTPVLHAERFTRGRGEFLPVDYAPAPERTDAERPFVLTTGRHLFNFHTNTMTGRSAGLAQLNDHGYAEIHPTDADELGVCDGDMVEIASKHGSVVTEAHVGRDGAPRRGVVFMPFHFADAPANRVTAASPLDPSAKMPGLKVTAVSVRKVSGG